ncbi:cation-transporting P-type ATPase, partial [Candidatus Peregrinibacteria bacterium]|nr:cation-transporting P-type ATPase [Candidatus Peregrinibacteria bacterium]
DPIHDFKILQKQSPDIASSLELLTRIATLCNNAKFEHWIPLGDPTEAALLTVGMKLGFDRETFYTAYPRIFELPFDSGRKMMTTIHKTATKSITAYTKGAPDQLLKHCTHIFQNGKNIPLTEEKKEEIVKENERMALSALRVIAFAYREIGLMAKKTYHKEEVEKNLIFVGLMGMIDPPRSTVKEAVALAKKAGIQIYIVTGDFGLTAKAIAQEIGLVQDEKNLKIITGNELENLDTEALKRLFKEKKEIIFARVSPEHKLKIVNTLKELDEIVAVTGDGVNDAPALKRADIGIAMGITGCDVSRSAADMVLADDSFSTIVTAVKEGRTIYQNLKKFIFYMFSGNIGELVTVFTAIALGMPSPLTAILILVVNLGTDVLPAIALSLEPSEKDVMATPPRRPTDHILKKNTIIRSMVNGFAMGSVEFAIFFITLSKESWTWGAIVPQDSGVYIKASTMAFALLLFIQMINALNCRSEKNSIFKIGFFTNKHLLGAITLSILTLIIFIEVPFLQKLIHTTHLSVYEWLTVVIASFSILIIEEVRKRFVIASTHGALRNASSLRE